MKFNRYVAPPTTLLKDYGACDSVNGASLRALIESEAFSAASEFSAVIGRADDGSPQFFDLKNHPHMIIGGQTGTGKTTLLNAIIVSLAYKCSPDKLRFILIDPKFFEFDVFNGLPHRMTDNHISSYDSANGALKWMVAETERRCELFCKCKCAKIDDYNALEEVISGAEKLLPHIVVIIDEYADLATSALHKPIEDSLRRVLQKSRAAGMHIIMTTQRPSSDVLSGVIKCNILNRIAFKTTTVLDSRSILNCAGAEQLTCRGEMLCSFIETTDMSRLQCAYVGNEEIKNVVEFLREHNTVERDESLETALRSDGEYETIVENACMSDPLFASVLGYFVKNGIASVSSAQRRFAIGYARAARLVDSMEECGFISPSTGNSKPRKVLITKEWFNDYFSDECILDECVDCTLDADDEDDNRTAENLFDGDDEIIDAASDLNRPVFPHGAADGKKAPDNAVPQFADEESKTLFVDILRHIAEKGKASTAEVQYSFGLTYVKTLRLFELMEQYRYIGQRTGNGFGHDVLITAAQINELFGEQRS